MTEEKKRRVYSRINGILGGEDGIDGKKYGVDGKDHGIKGGRPKRSLPLTDKLNGAKPYGLSKDEHQNIFNYLENNVYPAYMTGGSKKQNEQEQEINDPEWQNIEILIQEHWKNLIKHHENKSLHKYCSNIDFDEKEIFNIESLGVGIHQIELLAGEDMLDCRIANALCTLIQKRYPKLQGLQSTQLVGQHLKQRKKSRPPAAEIHHTGSNHFVSSFYRHTHYVEYTDSLNPGACPNNEVLKQIRASYDVDQNTVIRSHMGQNQKSSLDCLLFAAAGIYTIGEGKDPAKSQVGGNLRNTYLECLKHKELALHIQKTKFRGQYKTFPIHKNRKRNTKRKKSGKQKPNKKQKF